MFEKPQRWLLTLQLLKISFCNENEFDLEKQELLQEAKQKNKQCVLPRYSAGLVWQLRYEVEIFTAGHATSVPRYLSFSMKK